MLLCLSGTHRSTELAGIHLRLLSKLLREPTQPLQIIYQQSWLFKEVPTGWTLANIPPTYKQKGKEHPTLSFLTETHVLNEGSALDVFYLDFSKTYLFPMSSPGETGCSWLGHVYSLLGKINGWVNRHKRV